MIRQLKTGAELDSEEAQYKQGRHKQRKKKQRIVVHEQGGQGHSSDQEGHESAEQMQQGAEQTKHLKKKHGKKYESKKAKRECETVAREGGEQLRAEREEEERLGAEHEEEERLGAEHEEEERLGAEREEEERLGAEHEEEERLGAEHEEEERLGAEREEEERLGAEREEKERRECWEKEMEQTKCDKARKVFLVLESMFQNGGNWWTVAPTAAPEASTSNIPAAAITPSQLSMGNLSIKSSAGTSLEPSAGSLSQTKTKKSEAEQKGQMSVVASFHKWGSSRMLAELVDIDTWNEREMTVAKCRASLETILHEALGITTECLSC
jgi:hypothetical protein